MYGERVARWERAVEWPLTIAAVVFLGAYAVQILAHHQGTIEAICEVVIWATWAVFLVDYVVRLILTERRGRWFVRHLLDLAIVVLPMLRPLRLMRFLTVIALIQRNASTKLRGRVALYTVGATALIIVLGALAALDAEQGQGGPIENFGDAIWWAFETITTVGYGDYEPVTLTGRIVAVGLMIGGIALIGVVTATLAAWIVERVSLETEEVVIATEEHVEQLQQQLAQVRAQLDQMHELLRKLGGTG